MLFRSFIRQKLFGGKGDLSLSIEKQINDIKGLLLSEADFDLDKFLTLNAENSNEYIAGIKGFSIENMDQLAECLSQIGFTDNTSGSVKYLEKALQLHELCNFKSKTYSLEREMSIEKIKNIRLFFLGLIEFTGENRLGGKWSQGITKCEIIGLLEFIDLLWAK